MTLCNRCGNYLHICECEDVDMLSSRLSRHQHWIADLTREAESLLSFIDAKEEITPETFYPPPEGKFGSLSESPHLDNLAVSLIHSICNAPRMGEMATESPEPSTGQAPILWY